MNQLLVKVLAIAMLAAACTGATVKETTSLPGAPPSTPVSVQSTPVPPPTTTSTPTTTTASTTTAAPQAATVDPLLDRWIAVLASLPIDEYTEQEAAREAETFGIGDTNVLLSNEYGSLNGGYWVVYSGVFDQSLWAWDRCAELGGDCYARYLGGDPTVPPLLSEGQLWIWREGRLVAVSAEDGQIVRTITTGWADGQFAGPLQIAADRVTGYFDLGHEDSWFGCDATLGQFVEVDLVSGDTQLDHDGIMPAVSPAGDQLAFLAADECLEDPDEPQFYIAYHDEVVVRDLASGTERSWGPASGIAPDVSVVRHIAWTADGNGLFVALSDGTIRLLPLDSSAATALQDLEVLEYRPSLEAAYSQPVGQLNDGKVVMWGSTVVDDAFITFVDLFDPVNGTTSQIARATGDDPVFATVDMAGSTVLLQAGNRVWSIGAVAIDLTFDGYVHGVGG